jgi:hypothetical protein
MRSQAGAKPLKKRLIPGQARNDKKKNGAIL